ncbi:MAG: helix-turn-helix domain-containing protein [Pseudomonadota bacterium]
MADLSAALTKDQQGARLRILEAAYALFLQRGVAAVGIEDILRLSGCARASLYSHFRSKEALAAAAIDLQLERWEAMWDACGSTERGYDPEHQLIAIFEMFDSCFRETGPVGCIFVKILMETAADDPLHTASAAKMRRIGELIAEAASRAGLADADQFAWVWLMMLQGSVVSGSAGDVEAASKALVGARRLIADWPRRRLAVADTGLDVLAEAPAEARIGA